jgi:hypothetical protein
VELAPSQQSLQHLLGFYLHTLVEYFLELNLTIGMLENSGAERRHEIRRVQFKKALSGGGRAFRGTKAFENRSAYLTLPGAAAGF